MIYFFIPFFWFGFGWAYPIDKFVRYRNNDNYAEWLLLQLSASSFSTLIFVWLFYKLSLATFWITFLTWCIWCLINVYFSYWK